MNNEQHLKISREFSRENRKISRFPGKFPGKTENLIVFPGKFPGKTKKYYFPGKFPGKIEKFIIFRGNFPGKVNKFSRNCIEIRWIVYHLINPTYIQTHTHILKKSNNNQSMTSIQS